MGRSYIRKPSISKRVSARTTGKATRALKRAVNPTYGKKGIGFINDPKKCLYNKIYNNTTIGVDDIFKGDNKSSNKSSRGVDDTIIGIANGIVFTIILIAIIASCVIVSWIF